MTWPPAVTGRPLILVIAGAVRAVCDQINPGFAVQPHRKRMGLRDDPGLDRCARDVDLDPVHLTRDDEGLQGQGDGEPVPRDVVDVVRTIDVKIAVRGRVDGVDQDVAVAYCQLLLLPVKPDADGIVEPRSDVFQIFPGQEGGVQGQGRPNWDVVGLKDCPVEHRRTGTGVRVAVSIRTEDIRLG